MAYGQIRHRKKTPGILSGSGGLSSALFIFSIIQETRNSADKFQDFPQGLFPALPPALKC
mgnify:CR=1 FL=1